MAKTPPAFTRADRLYVGCTFAFYFLLIGFVLLLIAAGEGDSYRRSEARGWFLLAATVFGGLGAGMLVLAFWYKRTYLDRCNKCRYPREGLSRGVPCPECGEDDPGV